jgi:hypothetical protein
MIVHFGAGKCPLCGDFAKELDRKTLHCPKCEVAFDEFLMLGEAAGEYNKGYWN